MIDCRHLRPGGKLVFNPVESHSMSTRSAPRPMPSGPKSNDRLSRTDQPGEAPRLQELVRDAVANQPLVDVHTHLCPPTFGSPLAGRGGKADPDGLLLWG